ncbi:MAG: diguanylate cyclase, partial [Bacteroidetes bacterium]|nr:diguanylate cyclase [Bacteroidota bacterium]
MADLTTKFAGLTLKNPVIVGSSGLTDSVEKIVELEKNGAGAVVIKSLFEEEIMAEAEYKMKKAEEDTYMYARFSESFDYIDMHVKSNRLEEYVSLVKKAKSSVMIPVIASVNCVSPYEWTSFAKRLQDAGADALELNVFVLPADEKRSGAENEKIYFEVVEKILKVISIP